MSQAKFYLQQHLTNYHANVGYDTANGGAGDADMCAAFIKAARGLLTLPSQSGKGSAHQQFNASHVREELKVARRWFAANSARAKQLQTGPAHPCFQDLRREGDFGRGRRN